MAKQTNSKITKIFVIAMIILCFGVVNAQTQTDLKNTLSKEKLSSEEVTSALGTLTNLVEGKTSHTVKELLELCLLYSKHDRSEAIYGYPGILKASHPVEFEKAMKELSKKDAQKINKFIEISEGLFENGNG